MMLLKILLIFLLSASLYADDEENIKQVYLEKFSMFITWPKKIETFNVCVYNDKLFATKLQDKYASRKFNNYPLKVSSFTVGDSSINNATCHMLYLRHTKSAHDTFFTQDLNKENMLIISDEYDEIYRNSMISFYIDKNKFRFAINKRNLDNAGLKASYKLLKFAKVVDSSGDTDVK